MPTTEKTRKIIHVDMDCFYAAIEIRDNPTLADKPVAVGGPSHQRSVLCTCNYIARKFGIHSAMSTTKAYRKCNDLIVLPVNMPKYRQVAKSIHAIFREFSDLVEPLSLDEAYIDVTESKHCQGSATWIAQRIRQRIWEVENLAASAGVAPNKFLAKIASGWRKPNGLFVISPEEVSSFIKTLPITELYGVGKVTAEKLLRRGLKTCADLQNLSLLELVKHFGKLGQSLYGQCRGIDHREVESNRLRKSLSVEETFSQDIVHLDSALIAIDELHTTLLKRIQQMPTTYSIKNQFIKIKYSDFKTMSAEMINHQPDLQTYKNLLEQLYAKENKPIRLLGLGVHFKHNTKYTEFAQSSIFD